MTASRLFSASHVGRLKRSGADEKTPGPRCALDPAYGLRAPGDFAAIIQQALK